MFDAECILPTRLATEQAFAEYIQRSVEIVDAGQSELDCAQGNQESRCGTLPLRIVAGPFLPEAAWAALQQDVAGREDITLIRQAPDMAAEMAAARASISQCGYNTALDIVVSGVPALVVPYSTVTLQFLAPESLTPDSLAEALTGLLTFTPKPAALALNGAQRSTALLHSLVAAPLEHAA